MKPSYGDLERTLQLAEQKNKWLKDLLKKALDRIDELEQK